MGKKNFNFLLAKRNILANKKTTLVIIITLSLIFSVFIMMLGIRGIYKSIFTKEAETRHSNLDIVISYDEYSVARLINKRGVIDNYEEIDYALAFFNLQVLSENSQDLYYSQLFSSLTHEFEILMDVDIEIKSNEAIITESYAKNHGLSVNDKFSFYILDSKYEYEVSDIIKDSGIFSKDSFFIDKEDLLNKVYGSSYLGNFGNNIYIKSDNPENLYEDLKIDEDYNGYNIKLVVDQEKIESIVNEYTSIIVVAGLIVLISLVIVLNSLFIIVLKDIYIEIGVFETLGDNKKLGYKVTFHQWLIYILLSFVIGLVLSHIVVNIGAYFYGINDLIFIDPLVIVSSFLLIIIMVYLRNILLLKKHYQKNTIEKIRDKRFILGKYNYILLFISLVVLTIVMLFEPFEIKYNSLLIVILSMYLSMNVVVMFLKLLSKFPKKSSNVFSMFNRKHMDNNKNIHQSLVIIFLSLIVVAIMLTVRIFISEEIKQVKENNHVDILMVNIFDYDNDLVDEIQTYDVETVDSALIYRDVLVDIGSVESILIRTFVSVDFQEFSNYFSYKLGEIDSIYTEHELPFILFPKSYEIVYKLTKGDIVKLDLSPELKDIDFVVGGFVDTNFDQFVYTNLYERLDYYQIEKNSIMINSDNKESLMQDLIKDYSARMYYFIDADAQLEEQLTLAANVLALFTVITIFVILSFIFVVFNNTVLKFYSLKNDYAKIKVIGISNKNNLINLSKEFSLMFLTLVLVGLIEIWILSKYLRFILLFFDYYKDLSANVTSISLSFLIIFISLLSSYVYYYLKVKNIAISEEIRLS